MKFSLSKYKKYWVEVQGLPSIQVDKLIYLSDIANYDGQELDILLAQGKMILKEWCE